ncbi:MAG: amidohydrolase/deacetylase family metallohydrolase [Paenibacillaceae bacterium]|nr:amidohydrolase/deacetylase family metallohydrolase [Paenibacillaceae bacterium]
MPALLLKQATLFGFGFGGASAAEPASVVDILIDEHGFVAAVGPTLVPPADAEVIDLRGCHLSPGWIDMHAHVYDGVSNIGLNPDDIGPATGVTGIVDAGSAGAANYAGLRDYVIAPRPYPIVAFLNVGLIGLTYASQVSELDSMDKLNVDRLLACIDANRDTIKGIKLRASGVILRGWGIDIVKLARRAADEADLPLMIHVGEPLPLLEDILDVLAEGDIVTHIYHGKRFGLFNRRGLIPQAERARERGVLFDVGHGAASFSFAVAERAIALGFTPHTIGTDLHARNIGGPVWDMPATMSKLLAAGLPLADVIRASSTVPAGLLGLETYANGLIGAPARFTAFDLTREPVEVVDSEGAARTLNTFIRPRAAIVGARHWRAESRLLRCSK